MEKEKEILNSLLKKRFKFYCVYPKPIVNNREEHHRIAEALADDLTTNEWETLKPRLQYWEAQGFYGSRELWEMLERAKGRIGDEIFDLHPLPDAIVHALLDAGNQIKRVEKSE